MSLKAFHIVFVACSILLAIFCGVWLLHDYASSRNTGELAVSIFCLASVVVLLAYGKSVLRKLKHISYL